MIAALTERMIRYNAADAHQINHAIKVAAYAAFIADRESSDAATIELVTAAGILHDIGIHNAQRTHGSTCGPYQEIEGPPVARDLMDGLNIPGDVQERICFLVGHHHTYGAIDGIDFQILVEADFIVNVFEEGLSASAVESIRRKVFKTRAGIELLDTLYPGSPEAGGS